MDQRHKPLKLFGTPVEHHYLSKSDVKSRLAGEGFEPPAYGFEGEKIFGFLTSSNNYNNLIIQ